MLISILFLKTGENVQKQIIESLNQTDLRIQEIRIADHVEEGLQILKEASPDLLIYELEPEEAISTNVLEASESFYPQTCTIYISPTSSEAIPAFRHDALDFLLSPLHAEEVLDALEKFNILRKRFEEKQIFDLKQLNILKKKISQMQAETELFPIPNLEGIDFIPVSSIIHCKSDSNTCDIFCCDGKVHKHVNFTLKFLEERLEPFGFIRVHQSHLVNKSKIKSQQGSTLILKNGSILPISRRKLKTFRESFQ